MIGIKDFFKGSAEGLVSGITNGASKIISNFKADPTKIIEYEKELKELETNANLKILELSNTIEEAYLKDTQSARESFTKIQESEKASWMAKNIAPLLTIMVTLGFFSLLIYMLKYEVPKSNERIMDILLGSLGTAWVTQIAFYFGSSQGSKENSKTLHHMIKNMK